MKKLLTLFLLASALLAACGPQATPTISPADVQNTAVAAALTMVALTQAAIPTATPVPPTETPTPTPLPTDTPTPEPTSSVPTLAPTNPPPVSGGNDSCNKPLSTSPAGPTASLKIQNNSSGPINLSLSLNQTPFGECGYRGFSNIAKGDALTVELPQGCYSAYAWINGKNPKTVSGGGYCMNNSDQWTLIIRDTNIVLTPP